MADSAPLSDSTGDGSLQLSNCPICQQLLDEQDARSISRVHSKGLSKLKECSQEQNNTELYRYLCGLGDSDILRVHKLCYRTCTHPTALKSIKRSLDSSDTHEEDGDTTGKKLRSCINVFEWEEHCFLCGSVGVYDSRHPDRNPITLVETIQFKTRLIEQCDVRCDEWGGSVKQRLLSCIDLVAAEARYHKTPCYYDFMRSSPKAPPGRPVNTKKEFWFKSLCEWLEVEGDAELYTLTELYSRMCDLAAGDEVFSEKWLKTKLIDHYGDHIFFAQMGGTRKDVVCFRRMANFIVNEVWHQNRSNNEQDEVERLMTAAGRLVKEEIRAGDYSKEMYPSTSDISDLSKNRDFLPLSLRYFLDVLIKDQVSLLSLGQAIVQRVRPNSVISPILFGLGVELDHVFGSRWLVDELYKHAMSISYDEVNRFRHSVIQDEVLATPDPDVNENSFSQWVGDNLDSNICTLTGEGTFHGMGSIVITTNSASLQRDYQVKRKARLRVADLVHGKGIPIVPYYRNGTPALSVLQFEPYKQLKHPYVCSASQQYTDLIWKCTKQFNLEDMAWMNWSGFSHKLLSSEKQQRDDITMLPIIDMNPNDENCIYSLLTFLDGQAHKLGYPCATVTFDQPLWLKATEIVLSTDLNIVVRLGGFHMLMSAVGSLFHTMSGSGIQEALSQVFAENSVVHMMAGKEISRALRALYLVDAALSTKLVEFVTSAGIDAEYSLNCDRLSEEEIHEIQELVLAVSSGSDDGILEKVITSPALSHLGMLIDETKIHLKAQSRTAKLWIQLLEYITVIKEFVTSERVQSWHGHLRASEKLLNLFAATGHVHYAKCTRLYLQMMHKLPTTHPWLYRKFSEGGAHSVRRTENDCNGIWTDLTIEQTLMRSAKSRGGLSRGRGFTESVRHQWVLTLHIFSAVHEAMAAHVTKRRGLEGHVDMRLSRCRQDSADLDKLLCWFGDHSPFEQGDGKLRSLSSGITAQEEDSVNCDDVEAVGEKIQTSMDGSVINSAKIKRTQQVRTLQDLQPGIKVKTQTFNIQPAMLFIRCTNIANRLGESLLPYFNYELCAEPPALFYKGLMRQQDKASLARELMANVPNKFQQQMQSGFEFVIDGGWLLNYVRWKKKCTYEEVFQQYKNFLMAKFGICTVVFDGYAGPSTKDETHMRRSCGKMSATIAIRPDAVTQNQAAFLTNTSNKVSLIQHLSEKLTNMGHSVKCSTGDADTLIVQTAVDFAKDGKHVQVVADDTDILILLVHHWQEYMADVYVRTEPKVSTKTTRLLRIADIVDTIGDDTRKQLLVIHAWSGCDTTSSQFNLGKRHIYNEVLAGNQQLSSYTLQLLENDLSQQEVGQIGQALFLKMYRAKPEDSLTSLRLAKYDEMVAKSPSLKPEYLPPTGRAAYYHSLRVYHQAQVWAKLDINYLDPLQWGWQLNREVMRPIMTDMDIAPPNVLKVICCKCKVVSERQCGTNLCSCNKHGMRCMPACGGCRGVTCKNKELQFNNDENEETLNDS